MKIAGVPLRVSAEFGALAILFGVLAARDVARTRLYDFPDPPADQAVFLRWLEANDLLDSTPDSAGAGWAWKSRPSSSLAAGSSRCTMTAPRASSRRLSSPARVTAAFAFALAGDARVRPGVAAELAVDRILSALAINAGALVINLLPFRSLGGQLLVATRLWLARQPG